MPALTRSPAWKALKAHHKTLAKRHLRELFAADPRRFDQFSLQFNDILLDYSKNRINKETLRLLIALAKQAELKRWIKKILSGEKINNTENRAALHMALRNRSGRDIQVDGRDLMPQVEKSLEHMRRFSDAVRSGTTRGHTHKAFTDVVNLGIGGSHLGPLMVTKALKPYASPHLRLHFVSNVDGSDLADALRGLNPETTLFLVVSKTFTTAETLANARSARKWLLDKLPEEAVTKHFAAVSANPDAAKEFGILANHVFEFWDWVGGRYSLWSAVGLSIAISIGMDNFSELLGGAYQMDEHFIDAPLEKNMPVILGLLSIWYTNFFGAETHAVLPYDQLLRYLPAYLQQLEMESNGKRVTRDGEAVNYATAPIIWGEAGTNGQHSFYQLIAQGTRFVPMDFLAACEAQHTFAEHHALLLANFFAQSEGLMQGQTESEVDGEPARHKAFPGNQPSNSILFRKLDPKTLGALIALYEHKVFVESVIWNVNPFDQWGVELGKTLAKKILRELFMSGKTDSHDSSTNGLINYFKEATKSSPPPSPRERGGKVRVRGNKQ
ncbi:MAG TPA: glucose-6-phosphate isomerase [Burkholderiales bacterium]|nr:glucose-6-phosphate isomerase [Burkholderiales bacterium]